MKITIAKNLWPDSGIVILTLLAVSLIIANNIMKIGNNTNSTIETKEPARTNSYKMGISIIDR